MTIIEIDDAGDPRLALYRNIPDAELRRASGVFIAEGRLVVSRLLREARLTPRSLLVTRTALAALDDPPVIRPALPVYVVSQDVMNTVTGINLHRGCLGLADRPPRAGWATLARGARRLVILE